MLRAVAWARKSGSGVRISIPALLKGATLHLVVTADTDDVWRSVFGSAPATRALFDQSPAGLLVYDHSLHVVECNARFAEIVGATTLALRGFDLNAIEDTAFPVEKLRAALTGEVASYVGPYFTTLTHRNLYIAARAAPLRDGANEIIGGIVHLDDVTEPRRAQDALRESEARYRDLVERTPAPIVVHTNGRIIFANEAVARVLGAAGPADVVGRMMVDIVHQESRAKVVMRVESVLETRRANGPTTQRLLRIDDGEPIDVEVTSIPIQFDGAQAVLTVGIDVTEARRLEAQLRQSQKMEAVGQLAGGIAHDFNNLLTVIQNCVAFLGDELPPDGPARADLDEIDKAANRAAGLTRQLLAFSRKQVLRPTRVDLNEIVAEIGTMLRRLIGEGISVSMALDAEPAWMNADRGQLEQIIVNLAVNARDAMREGGTLTISTALVALDADEAQLRGLVGPARFVQLAVADTGAGMDEATRAQLFEPFFTTKDPTRNSGLGLATVYGIVRQSGGAISVTSELGRGATFTLLFPCDTQ